MVESKQVTKTIEISAVNSNASVTAQALRDAKRWTFRRDLGCRSDVFRQTVPDTSIGTANNR